MADIHIFVQSFEEQDIYDALCTELADAYASFLQTDNPVYENRYYVLLRTLRNMERFFGAE